ncbi:MAG: thermonuclease family protein [Myxococcota bacterium]
MGEADADIRSLTYINGDPVSVRFSDGDTFRTFGGPYPGSNTRLGGFNTLESYGPVHRWGNWHPYELYINAKQATLNARQGVWHCFADGERDGYGRILADCPDLAVDQIRKGYAHAMTIEDEPSRPAYLRAQQEAIRNRRGMWAHGVPDFVMTSTHSVNEYPENDTAKNRLISTRDGHSESLVHSQNYGECEWICNTEIRTEDAQVEAFARALRADPQVAPMLSGLSNLLVIEIVDRYSRLQQVPEWATPELRRAAEPRLSQAHAAGALGGTERVRGSCMLYVPFERRYNRERPACLRGHGDGH